MVSGVSETVGTGVHARHSTLVPAGEASTVWRLRTGSFWSTSTFWLTLVSEAFTGTAGCRTSSSGGPSGASVRGLARPDLAFAIAPVRRLVGDQRG